MVNRGFLKPNETGWRGREGEKCGKREGMMNIVILSSRGYDHKRIEKEELKKKA